MKKGILIVLVVVALLLAVTNPSNHSIRRDFSYSLKKEMKENALQGVSEKEWNKMQNDPIFDSSIEDVAKKLKINNYIFFKTIYLKRGGLVGAKGETIGFAILESSNWGNSILDYERGF